MTVTAARNTPVEHGSSLHPFLVTHGFGLYVCRLGLASFGRTALTPDDILLAVDRGVNFLNWQGLAEGACDGHENGELVGVAEHILAWVKDKG